MGGGLAGLGLSQAFLNSWCQRYQQALAAPSPRKLALLVGINQYERYTQWPDLQGCVTDVELQQALLVHRFGFQPQDVLMLTNLEATREAIEAAFVSHLIEQARAGDLVVVHFSGYGAHIPARIPTETNGLAHREQHVLLPADALAQTNGTDRRINGVLEDTLFLLLRALPTDWVTTILDAGFVGAGTTVGGGLQVRSQPLPEGVLLCEAELAFQSQLLQQTALSAEQVSVQQRAGQIPGLLLSTSHQAAVEAHWAHTQAGLLTYWLTQRLWNAMPPTTTMVTFSRIATAMEQQVGATQQPELHGQKSYDIPLLGYGTPLGPAADGVILAVDVGKHTAQCWLGGLHPTLLEETLMLGFDCCIPSPLLKETATPPASQVSQTTTAPTAPVAPVASQASASRVFRSDDQATAASLFPAKSPVPSATSSATPSAPQAALGAPVPDVAGATRPTASASQAVDQSPVAQTQPLVTSPPPLIIKKHQGLATTARLSADLIEGATFLQEALRELPRSLTLQVALGQTLDRMERVDATSAFSSAIDVATVTSDHQYADVLLTQVPAAEEDGETPDSRYALFRDGGELFANTIGEPGEAIKTAVRRLTPQLEVLLAAKLLNLTVNDATAKVGVSVTLEQIKTEDTQPLIYQSTPRAPWLAPSARPVPKAETMGKIVAIPQGSHIQYRVQNYSPLPLYLLVFALDPTPDQLWYYAPLLQSEATENAPLKYTVIHPQESLTLPKTATEWLAHGPPGLATTYFLFCRRPWQKTLDALATYGRQSSRAATALTLRNPGQVVKSVLADLHQATVEANRASTWVSDQGWLLDVQQWATLAFVHRIS